MKLISMTDYVLEQDKILDDELIRLGNSDTRVFSYAGYSDNISIYAKLLKRLRELWMFIPCDEDGKPMEEPHPKDYSGIWSYTDKKYYWDDDGQVDWDCYQHDLKRYQKAKERVLFEGLELVKITPVGWEFKNKDGETIFLDAEDKIIEDLIPYNLTLTKEAINNLK